MSLSKVENVAAEDVRDDDQEETPSAGVSRRQALAKLGIGVSVAYAAPALLTLSRAVAHGGSSGSDGDDDSGSDGSSDGSDASGPSGGDGDGDGDGDGAQLPLIVQ